MKNKEITIKPFTHFKLSEMKDMFLLFLQIKNNAIDKYTSCVQSKMIICNQLSLGYNPMYLQIVQYTPAHIHIPGTNSKMYRYADSQYFLIMFIFLPVFTYKWIPFHSNGLSLKCNDHLPG